MSDSVNSITKNEELIAESSVNVNVNALDIKNPRLVSSQKLLKAFECYLIDDYILFGKPKSNQMSQVRANSVLRHIVDLLFGHRSTIPWNWQTHALVTRSMMIAAGFDSDHLLIIEFFHEDSDEKITVTLYSSKSSDVFENMPSNFDDFCSKLADICKETASIEPKPEEPSPMVALFIYSPANHKVINLIEEGTEIKSALKSLLCKLGIIKDHKLCKVRAYDPFGIFPDSTRERRHVEFRKLVIDYQQKLKNWPVTVAEHENLLDQIEKTVPFDTDFYKSVEKFATKYLPKRDKNDPHMIFLSRYKYHDYVNPGLERISYLHRQWNNHRTDK